MAFLSTKIDGFEILIYSNIGSMISSYTCSNVLVWNLAYISVISWSFSKIFLLNIGLINTYKIPPCLACYLIRAQRYSSGNIQKNWNSGHLAAMESPSLYIHDITQSSFACKNPRSSVSARQPVWRIGKYLNIFT